MMKKRYAFFKIILLIGAVGFNFSCNIEPFPELPPETQ